MKLFYRPLTGKQYTIELLYHSKMLTFSLKELIMFRKALLCVLCFTLFLPFHFSCAEEAVEGGTVVDYQYFPLEPDIITNYIKPGKRIGYVRVSIELMVNSSSDYASVEMHAPLIRDRIITIFGEQNEAKVKSLAEREIIRQRCLNEINEVIYAVTGNKPIQDLHFTKYIYR